MPWVFITATARGSLMNWIKFLATSDTLEFVLTPAAKLNETVFLAAAARLARHSLTLESV